MRKVFLEDLPRKKGIGANKEKDVIDWNSSLNYKIRFIYDGIEDEIEILDYETKSQYLIIRYEEKEFKIKTSHFLGMYLGRLFGTYTNEFKFNLNERVKDGNRNFTIVDRENRNKFRKNNEKKEVRKWYKYHCDKCSYEGWIEESNLLKGGGCSCCRGLTVVLGINTIWDTDRQLVELGMSEEDAKKYTSGSHCRIEVKCPNCNSKKKIRISDLSRRKSIGCTCGDDKSYIYKYIYSVLTQLSVPFDTEVKYKWNKYTNPLTNKTSNASIDFIIYKNKRKIPLEADGAFHRQDNLMNGITLKMSQNIDKKRDENCLKYLNEETIRLSDEGDIKENILKSILAKEFDLSNISWDKCEEFALKNLVKKVCNYWNNKKEYETTSDLAKVFKVSTTTVRRYLLKGNGYDWCYYDAKNEVNETRNKLSRRFGKKVEVFKDGVYLGVFLSCSELSKQSEELFGIKLNKKRVSDVCLKKLKHHKGFTFKYVE